MHVPVLADGHVKMPTVVDHLSPSNDLAIRTARGR